MKNKFLISLICISLCTSITACSTSSKKTVENSKPTIANETKVDNNQESEEYISLETMNSIPEFKCKDINGNEVTNEIFKDKKLTLINFWGTWWGPCVAELPNMQDAYDEIKDTDVNIIGIVEDGKNNEPTVKKILSTKNVSYTNIIADDQLYDDLVCLVGAFPTSILVNDKGEILKVKLPDKNDEIVKMSSLSKDQILDILNKN